MFDIRLTFVSLFINDAHDETTNTLMRNLIVSYFINYYFNMQDVEKDLDWYDLCLFNIFFLF